jgi:hypothetical protein
LDLKGRKEKLDLKGRKEKQDLKGLKEKLVLKGYLEIRASGVPKVNKGSRALPGQVHGRMERVR